MMFQFIATVALASTASANEPAETLTVGVEAAEPAIVRVYDLDSVVPGVVEWGNERLLPQLAMARGSQAFWFPGDQGDTEDFDENVIELIYSALGAELELEGRRVELWSNNRVVVKGPEETHARVRAVVTAAEELFRASSAIRVDVFELAEGQTVDLPQNGVMPADRWSAVANGLVSGGAHRESTTLRLEEGRTARSGNTSFYEFIAGYDVEVAQSAFIYDPNPGTARVGTRISAQGSPQRGGIALALSVQSTSLAGEPARRDLATGGILGSEAAGASHLTATGMVVVPNLSTRIFAADAFLPNGHVLLFGGATDLRSGSGTELVVVSRLDATPPRGGTIEVPGTGRRFLVVPAGAVAPPALEIFYETLWSENTGGTLIASLPRNRNGSEAFDTSVGFPREWEWLVEYVGLSADLDDLSLWSIGPWVVLGGGGEAASRLPEPASFSSQDSEPLTVDLALSDGVGGNPVTTRVSLRVGGDAMAVLGYERTAIPTYDVEVAQFAAVADPDEHLLFDGMAVLLSASRGASGALHLEVKLRASLESREPSIVRLEGFERLDVDSFEHQQFFADGRFTMEPGQDRGLFTLGGESGDGTPALSIRVH